MTKNIYRFAIVDNHEEVIYLSSIFFSNKKAAIKEIEKLTNFKEEIKTQERIYVCITIANNYTWKIFERIRKGSNERYIGIISETMILDVNASLDLI